MPTVAEIERLQAILERLDPLTDKQRGELIAADDWNALVEALIEIGRAALTAGDAETVPPHEHTDQVGIGWLDPRVRQLLTGGGVKDPAVESSFVKLRRDIGSLSTRLDRVGVDVDQSRLRIDEVATNDTARETMIARLNRKVLGAEDGRADIADLRGTLATLQGEVGRAIEVGAVLQRNGQTIDVAALADRVDAVETLRDRLTAPSGQLFDAAALEIRLQEMQAGFVSQGDLTEAIDDVRNSTGAGIDLAGVLDEARLAAREVAAQSVDSLGAGLRADIAGRFDAIGPTVDQRVAVATETLRDDVLSAARQELGAAVSGGDAAVRSDLTGLIDERFAAAGAMVEQRLSGLPDLVGAQVAQQLSARLDDALSTFDGRVAKLEASIDGLSGRITANETSIATNDLKFERARREDAASRAALRTELLKRIDGVDAGIDPKVRAAIDDARTVLRTDLDASVAAARRDLETRLAQVARETAATEVKVLATSIRTDVQSLIREEVATSLDVVRSEISSELSQINQRVAGMVSNAVTRATADLPRMVSAEVDAFRPEFERIVDTRVTRNPVTPITPIR